VGIFKFARCGYTLRVTSQASYSPECITPTQKNHEYCPFIKLLQGIHSQLVNKLFVELQDDSKQAWKIYFSSWQQNPNKTCVSQIRKLPAYVDFRERMHGAAHCDKLHLGTRQSRLAKHFRKH
jgi:hypothetical protein